MTKTIICGRCNTTVTLTKLVSVAHQKGTATVQCPKCHEPVVPKSMLPPTKAQLQFIHELGGNSTGIATRGQAKDRISKLLKEE